MPHGAHKKSYVRQMLGFYFAPLLRSFLTVIYLLFFLYFVVYFLNNVILSFQFIFYTFSNSNFNWSLGYLFWGALFTIALVIPFSLSLYAIVIPFEIKKMRWSRARKFLMITLVIVATMDMIVATNFAVQVLEQREPAHSFLIYKGIQPTSSYF